MDKNTGKQHEELIAFFVAHGRHILGDGILCHLRHLSIGELNLVRSSVEYGISIGTTDNTSMGHTLASPHLCIHHLPTIWEFHFSSDVLVVRIGIVVVVVSTIDWHVE
jgi:hypothetical protein